MSLIYVFIYVCKGQCAQKRVSDPFEMELTGPCHLPDVGAGNGTLVFCKHFLRVKLFLQPHQLLFLNVYLYD